MWNLTETQHHSGRTTNRSPTLRAAPSPHDKAISLTSQAGTEQEKGGARVCARVLCLWGGGSLLTQSSTHACARTRTHWPIPFISEISDVAMAQLDSTTQANVHVRATGRFSCNHDVNGTNDSQGHQRRRCRCDPDVMQIDVGVANAGRDHQGRK